MEKEDSLEVQMLGGFSMTFRGKKVQIGKNQTTKGLRLLQLLLHTYPQELAKQEVLAQLFGQDHQGDVGNNLRVVVHNLRKVLLDSELPKENYIRVEDGKYSFTSSFPVKVDAQTFAQLVQQASGREGEEKLRLLQQASRLYHGLFLPALTGEEWVMVADAYYQHLYFACMEEICQMMKERGEYEEMMPYCAHAAALYPFDEWQVWQMECLVNLDRAKEAMELYEKTTSMYFDELGLPPSQRMLELFQRMSSQIQMNVSDFNIIQRNLKEHSEANGAFCCSYPCFMNLYRLVARMTERSGQSNYLMLCTIVNEKYQPLEKSDALREISDKLHDSIQESLRRGDVVTRYNLNQFLVILMGIHEPECTMISERIERQFRKRESSRKVNVLYRVALAAGVGENKGS